MTLISASGGRIGTLAVVAWKSTRCERDREIVTDDAVFDLVCATFRGRVAINRRATPEFMRGRLGYHYVEADGSPQVFVLRDLEGVRKLATLTHELGHYESRLRGLPAAYIRAIDGDARQDWLDRPEEENRAVLDEEVLAWQLGRLIARDHGLTDDVEYLAEARLGLASYRDRLTISPTDFDAALEALSESPPER